MNLARPLQDQLDELRADRAKVTLKEIAVELGLTERRVRQRVDECILPPPTQGVFDADLCRIRYRQYKRGPAAD